MNKKTLYSVLVATIVSPVAFCASILDRANYDEAKVPKYELPDVLSAPGCGAAASSAVEWTGRVRPRVLGAFENDIYGKLPPRCASTKFEILEQGEAFGGKALRRQIRITVSDAKGSRSFDMLLFSPMGAKGKTPVFLGLNFMGNHSTCFDKNVMLAPTCDRKTGEVKQPSEADRGTQAKRWPYEAALARGYAVATIYYCQIYPDYPLPESAQKSIYGIFSPDKIADRGGAIAAWTWGISRAIDCLETLPDIDAKRIAVLGHSRLGKTSLYAGATDGRVALLVSNNSGCMGSALSRRKFGETLELMLFQFPHWLDSKIAKYSGKEEDMPIDQHQLMALIAPRPLYITSASEDLWADPRGELMALVEASKVYALFGARALPSMENFEIEKPFMGDVGYHLRRGKHDILEYDWKNFLDFADIHFFGPGKR